MLAPISPRRYIDVVTVNPVADLGRSNYQGAQAPQDSIAGAFFVLAMPLYGGGCAWDTFGCAGFLDTGRPTRVQLPPPFVWPRLVAAPQSRSNTMKHTRSPSTHAAAWKARAFAALRSNSSLAVRINRYNEAMSRARALEAQEVSHA